MLRGSRLLLSVLLCLLVLSWGTSPCVLARALELQDASGNADESGVPACCCKQAQDDASETPGDCPCCKRGGSLRDLPPPSGDDVLDAAAEQPFLAMPIVDVPVLESLDAPTPWNDTGPPEGSALQGCPVGIVLLLS